MICIEIFRLRGEHKVNRKKIVNEYLEIVEDFEID